VNVKAEESTVTRPKPYGEVDDADSSGETATNRKDSGPDQGLTPVVFAFSGF
jgi:hypothetical protein